MRLWRRASGALKDKNSLWIASLSKRTAVRHPEIESAVVKATSHVESSLDRPSVERACNYLQRSPFHLKPILWSLSNRMERTRSWPVALKGLFLMHTLINSKLPGVNKIGRLPFDLSDFKDAHSRHAWSFNTFVRAYYSFLDHKSTLFYQYMDALRVEEEEDEGTERRRSNSITRELVLLHKLQTLIDLLIQIKPQARAAFSPVVLDVMEEIMIEIFQVYSRMCGGINFVVKNIYCADRLEAKAALDAVHKASRQTEQLSDYLEHCERIGVVSEADLSFIDRFPEEGIKELEQRVYEILNNEEKLAIVHVSREDQPVEKMDTERNTDNKSLFRTIITDKWEKFDEDESTLKNTFVGTLMINQSSQIHGKNQHAIVPDLISFV